MAFYGYNGDFNGWYWKPSAGISDYEDFATLSPFQSSSQFSSSYGNFSSDCFIENDSSMGLSYSDYSCTESEYSSSYSQFGVSWYPSEMDYSSVYHRENELRFLQHSPLPYDRVYFPSETNFRISYSTVGSDKVESEEEFNEPEFKEYDPTPYGGGYDPDSTYGKPLPPSDKICYPRTVPEFDDTFLENFSYSSLPSLYATDDDSALKPPNGDSCEKIEREPNIDDGDRDIGKCFELPVVIPTVDSPNHEEGFLNGSSGGFGYETPNRIPYGSGLESMDLCETIFGYWPCLAKMEKQERARRRETCDLETIRNEPWNIAADYLFGNPFVQDDENYLHYERVQYGYTH